MVYVYSTENLPARQRCLWVGSVRTHTSTWRNLGQGRALWRSITALQPLAHVTCNLLLLHHPHILQSLPSTGPSTIHHRRGHILLVAVIMDMLAPAMSDTGRSGGGSQVNDS